MPQHEPAITFTKDGTGKGAIVALKSMVMYSDGHGILYFADGHDWPFNNSGELRNDLAALCDRMQAKASAHEAALSN
jgi:hypothetical protein